MGPQEPHIRKNNENQNMLSELVMFILPIDYTFSVLLCSCNIQLLHSQSSHIPSSIATRCIIYFCLRGLSAYHIRNDTLLVVKENILLGVKLCQAFIRKIIQQSYLRHFALVWTHNRRPWMMSWEAINRSSPAIYIRMNIILLGWLHPPLIMGHCINS